MATGGMTPGGIVYMQEGRTVPGVFSLQHQLPGLYDESGKLKPGVAAVLDFLAPRRRAQFSVIREATALRDQGRLDEAVALLRSERIDPSVLGSQPPAAATPTASPAVAPAAAPARPPVVEAGIPAAGAALTSNAPPVAPPAAPLAPPIAAAVTPPVTPPAPAAAPAAQPTGPVSDFQSRVDQLTGSLPGIMSQIQSLTPQVPSLTLEDLQSFAPKPFDDSATMARREALINQLQETGRTRRAEDIAAAERYRSEAEAPIQSAQEEARKTAIASTLMRLGAGLAAGNPAQGLANASEAVENIMTRAREQATAERRAVRQEFRQAERDATRGERDMANTVFQMQAQQITGDEAKQREFARDQMQFSQWAFGQIRDQGKDQRQAYDNSIRLGINLLQSVDTAVREEINNKRISQDQYTSTVGSLLRSTTDLLKNNLPESIDLTTPQGQEQFNKIVSDIVTSQLSSFGISSPQSNMKVTSFEEISPTSLKVNGQTINFKTEEQANAFKKSIGR